ncbi:MAG: hypothetical protein FD123_359 [Bacteroidetes bacterium]|nr:MAG: hypothetical protein FD123_359 [Bacteroidota bacterium]
MANNFCTELGIPEYLHKDNRQDQQIFSIDEGLYRRFPKIQNGKLSISDKGDIDQSIFSTDNMSCNRQDFCLTPEDVLFSSTSNTHYFHYGIVRISIKEIENIVIQNTSIPANKYELKVVHDPEECMYPHTVVKIFENGVLMEKPPGPSIKISIRKKYAQICTLIKAPQ